MEMTKKEEKEIGTLLGVWNAFIPVHTFNKEEYVALFAFKEAIKGLEQEKENLSELNRKQSKAFKETMKDYRELLRDYMKIGEENKKLKEDVDYFRQCYLDLKKLCEKEGFMLSDEEVTKMFDLDKIK